jgi:hypothetical protein
VLLLDLREHEETWVRERLGDRWTGFSEETLRKVLRDAGLDHIKVTVGARRTGDPFTVLIASGVKPALQGPGRAAPPFRAANTGSARSAR